MIRGLFKVMSLISALLLVCTIVVWIWSFWADARKDRLSFSNDFHVGVDSGRIEFFSDENGPDHGGMIALTSPHRSIEGIFAKQQMFGDTLGIYYFRWADSGAVLWTLSVSLFYPVAVFSIPPLVWTWHLWRRRARQSTGGRCCCPPAAGESD